MAAFSILLPVIQTGATGDPRSTPDVEGASKIHAGRLVAGVRSLPSPDPR